MALQCNLKIILIQKNIKQNKFAEITGISRSNINLIANGKQEPTLENAMIIADALRLTIYDIWERI